MSPTGELHADAVILTRIAKTPIDPDAAECRDQRIGNWIVVLAYGSLGVLIVGG